jgi:hypothetical protein
MTDHSIGLTTTEAATDPAVDDIVVRLEGIPEELQGWLPSTDMVGLILRGRTRDANGRLQGIFTAQTDPTADQVTDLIADAAAEVASALPSPLPDAPGDDPDALRKAYQRVVARLAAANVELGYPTTRGGLDRYDRLLARYKDAKAVLLEAISEAVGGGGGESELSDGAMPAYSFDEACDHVEGSERPLPESWC